MELKYLHINEKQQNKELLISQKQVTMLKKFLKEFICNEVLIINTNLGLEVYYQSSNDCTKIIKEVLTIIVSKKCDTNDSFQFISFQNEHEIQRSIDDAIEYVAETPQFLSYTESMLSQLKLQYESNKKLIGKLSGIWSEVMQNLHIRNVSIQKIQALQNNFQDIYIKNVKDEVLKELIIEAVDKKHVN
ncbi:hypothetical protein [Kordia sp.]|uniref:hypothetical protein n=1 Tax=Kordia sp. TaxID=1965332 RepID=UPI003D2DC3CE